MDPSPPAPEPTAPAERSPRDRYADIVKRFGRAWEQCDHGAIAGLFGENGVLIPTPFDKPLRGREAVRAYWADLPKRQAEISFRYGEVFVAGPWFAVEFRCTFRRRRTGDWVDARGALFCETEGEHLTEMRMYWHRSVGGRVG